mmetsp:Transcript_31132/g.75244  ORF Transcript_31132/g.75244 Transcript_31132/m.75244 type:complete len:93 (-) Transcript_31132:72-350(-)
MMKHTDDNLFIGTIPDEFGKMTRLYELWLQNNALIGTLPTPIYEDLLFAYSIRVEGNSIDGCPADAENVQCSIEEEETEASGQEGGGTGSAA